MAGRHANLSFPFLGRMPSYRPVIGLIARRRTSSSAHIRFKASLVVPEVERTPSFRVHESGTNHAEELQNGPPQRIRLNAIVGSMIRDIKVGTMSLQMFGQGKALVIECCKRAKPELATAMLYRLIDECIADESRYKFTLYNSIFNVVLNAWSSCGNIERVEHLFSSMQHLGKLHPQKFPMPDIYSHNSLLSVWAASTLPSANNRMLAIFQEMEDSENVQPDSYSYNIVMSSYANRAEEYGAAKSAEDFLLRFSDRHANGFLGAGPGIISFNIVMKAWAKCGDETGAQRALEIFNLMKKLYADGHRHLKPDEVSLLAIMTAYSKKGDVEMTEKLFRNNQVDGDLSLCYNCLISAYANSRRPDAGDCAERIFAEMPDPSEKTYSLILTAHANADRQDAAFRCEDFLLRAVKKYVSNESHLRPVKDHFHIVLRAWRHHGDKQIASEKSLNLLSEMKSLAKKWKMQVKPDDTTISRLIDILAQFDVNKALELLAQTEQTNLIVHSFCYNEVLIALSQQPTEAAMNTAEAILRTMERNHRTLRKSYHIVLHGYLRMRDPASKWYLLELLQRMEQNGRALSQLAPDVKTYIIALRKLRQNFPNDDDVRNGAEMFNRLQVLVREPEACREHNLIAHSAYLQLLACVRSVYSAEKANECFELMQSKHYPVLPDSSCTSFMILANAHAPHPKFTHLAHQELLRYVGHHMEGKCSQLPAPECFVAVMHAWSLSQEECKVDKAVELINKAKELHEKEEIGAYVTDDLYSIFIDVLAAANAVKDCKKAEQVLHDFGETDVEKWNIVLRLWSRSVAPDKAYQTRRILLQMRDLHGVQAPNRKSYNAVFKSVAHSRFATLEESRKAIAVALETLSEMKASQGAQPDSISCATVLMCLRRHMEDSTERSVVISEIFEFAKEAGYIGSMFIKEMKALLVFDSAKETLGDAAEYFLSLDEVSAFPREWSRNVKPARDKLVAEKQKAS